MVPAEKRRSTLLVTIALIALNLIALQVLISGWSMARLDLTSDRLYSITPATERLLTSLEEEVTVLGYFSDKTHPKLAPLIPEIEDLLAEYQAVSGGQVRVEMIDPGEDEAAEEEANNRYGVTSTPFRLASKYETGIVNAYFALVVKYGDQYVRYGFEDLIEVEPLPDGEVDVRLRNLEYDLTRAIKKAAFGFRSSAELFERVDGPVVLTAIVTPTQLPEVFSDVPEALRLAADELSESGGDKFLFEEIDPSVDPSIGEMVYQEYGARPMAVGLFGGDNFYLYAILEVGDQIEQIPLTGESVTAAEIRESVEDALRRQTPGFLKRVGLVAPGSALPPEVRQQLAARGQQVPPPEYEQVRLYLEQEYTVENVNLNAESGVPSDVDVLLVVEPRGLSDRAVYNLDQFLMRGGRIVLCISNYRVNFGQSGLGVVSQSSGLESWLAHQGVTVENELILDDRNRPLPIPQVRQTPLGLMRTWSLAPYPYLISVRDDGLMNREITGGLESVGMYWASPVEVSADSLDDIELFEILQSSKNSWTSTDLNAVGFIDYEIPEEGTETHLLAAALSGRFQSYYHDRAPPARNAAAGEEDEPAFADTPLLESPDTRLVVVGNAAFLSDLVASVLSQPEGGSFTENLGFVQNLIDWSVLDNDLISIRARGVSSPRIDRIEQGAEMTIETVNYLVPVGALLALAFYIVIRRRNTAALVSKPRRRVETPSAVSEEGVG